MPSSRINLQYNKKKIKLLWLMYELLLTQMYWL